MVFEIAKQFFRILVFRKYDELSLIKLIPSMRQYFFLGIIIGLLSFGTDVHAQWTPTNGPLGGYISGLAAIGSDIFAGTYGGCVFTSSNNGATWEQTGNPLEGNFPIFSLYSSGSNLYKGGYYGVYISSDSGMSWNSESTGLPNANSPTTDITCFAVSGSNLFAGTGDSGIYLSTNSGANWIAIDSGIDGAGLNIYTLKVVGTNIFAGTLGGGIYESTNQGTSWTLASNGLTGYGLYVITLEVNGSNFFAGTSTGVFISTNNGGSWTQTGFGRPAYCLATSGTTLLVGTDTGIYLSNDSGKTWTLHNNGLTDAVVSLLVEDSNIFAGTIDGVFLSTNDGMSWIAKNKALTGFPVAALYPVGSNLLDGNLSDGGIYLSTNNGTLWNSVLTDAIVFNFAGSPENLLASGSSGGVYQSIDSGSTWNAINNGFPSNVVIRAVSTIGTMLFAGSYGNGIYKSSNNGNEWVASNIGLTGYSFYINTLAESGTSLFAGTYSGVFLSTDSGSSWNSLNAGNYDIAALVVSGNYIFAGTYGNGIIVSTNSGNTWASSSTGLPDERLSISALFVRGENIFASTSGMNSGFGVYLSTNNGMSWTSVGDGLTDIVNTFAIQDTDLFAGTEISGVWSRPLSQMINTSAVTPTASMQLSISAYPNPCSSSSTITFSCSESGAAKVTIVNLLGAEVARVYEGELSAGEHSFTWDASGAAPGMYECVVRENGNVQRTAISLLK